MRIRPLSYKNLQVASLLANDVFGGSEPGDSFAKSLLVSLKAFTYWQYWVVEEKGKIVGTLGLYQKRPCKTLWIGWFCLAESARGKGWGEIAFLFMETKARELKAESLRLYTGKGPSFEAACCLYEKMGMKRVEKKGTVYYSKRLK